MQTPQQPEPVTPDEAARLILADTVKVLRGLAPVCRTLEELIQLCEVAQTNDGQLRLLRDRIAPLELRQ